MRKIKFKNFKGHFFIEPYTKYDRAEIFDETKHYLGYVCLSMLSKKEYNNIVREYKNTKDEFDFFECFTQSYDYGTTPQSIMESYCADITLGWEYEDVCDEVLEITADIVTMTDEQLCNTYDINKIGKYYFRGNW